MRDKNVNIVYYAIIGAQLLIIASLITLINLDLNTIDRKFIADISGAIIGAILSGIFAIFVVNLQTKHNKITEENRIKENFNTTKKYLIRENNDTSQKLRYVYHEWPKIYNDMNNEPAAFFEKFILNKDSFEEIIPELIAIRNNVMEYFLHKNIYGMELDIILSIVEAIDEIIDKSKLIQISLKENSPYNRYFNIGSYLSSVNKYLYLIDNLKYNN